MNLRSKTKARVALKTEPSIATPSAPSDNPDLNEEILRKLSRAELQKLAMTHKVKANMKSDSIIQQLLRLRIPKKTRPAEDDFEQGPSRKRLKREVTSEEIENSPMPENGAAHPDTRPTQETPIQAGVQDSQPPELGPSNPRGFPVHGTCPVLSYDKGLFSGTESEMTEEEQNDFDTPVSSRSGTPPPAHVKNLERCVKIMQEISAQDVALLNQVTDVRNVAARLRKKARDVRELVKAECGRRDRMETYFRYWRDMETSWDRKWVYGEKMVAESKIRLEETDQPAGPPTIPARKPVLSPEAVRQKREAIISRQEGERRELEALQRERMRRENNRRELSSEAAWSDDGCLSEGAGSADLSSVDDANERLMISFENTVDTVAVSVTK